MQKPTKERWIVMAMFALILILAPWGGVSPERAIVIVLACEFIVVPMIKGKLKFVRQEQPAEVPQQSQPQRRQRRSTSIQPKIEFKLND